MSRRTGRYSPTRLYLAERKNLPGLAGQHHRQLALPENRQRISAFDLLWFSEAEDDPGASDPPLDRLFKGPTPLAVWRGSWRDPDALYVAMVAGNNPGPHGHLDLGGFELRADGVAWIRDLGKDNYSLPGYWETEPGGRRWNYTRLGTQGHNVPMLDGRQQRTPCRAEFANWGTPENPGVTVDLSSAYAPAKVLRYLRVVDDRRAVLLTDTIEAEPGTAVAWGLTVFGDVEPGEDGRTVLLRHDNKALKLERLAPAGGSWSVEPLDPIHPEVDPFPEKCRRLIFRKRSENSTTEIKVKFTREATPAE